ncbi:MAG: alpha-glucosidase [Ruminococcaceae bacterium]|nr:alpha-glucosidase [Oscillospiraceae bacterium]
MENWYKEAVVYQIYPKSFCDTNGDGIGDIPGIISKLDYLKELGINTIWLSPCYVSPGDDNGYDIADYRTIDPVYGTMEDFKFMLSEMNKRGIKLLMDLVVNHTSDEHEWFCESRKSKDNPYRDYYIWRDPVDGHEPNDWKSNFSGSAWEYDETTEQYYLHLFSKKQPDLNWENPKVRQEIVDMMKYWLDMGVSGFRCDVINLISKDIENNVSGDGPRLHEYIHLLNREALSPYDAMTVGEVWGLSPEESLMLTHPDREELSMVFQFEHMGVGRTGGRFYLGEFEPDKYVEVLAKWQKGLNGIGWNALCVENHDQSRCLNRIGNTDKYRYESATMIATLVYMMQGTPYIFQGQELGLINPVFHSLDECRDIEALNAYPELLKEFDEKEIMRRFSGDSRDCGRAPIPWDASEKGGFSEGEPWLKLHDRHREINAENDLKAEKSVYNYYKEIIKLHRENKTFLYGDFELISNKDAVSVYKRYDKENSYRVVCNFCADKRELDFVIPADSVILSNYPFDKEISELNPYQALIIKD